MVSCGAPLADGGYAGEPRMVLRGHIEGGGAGIQGEVPDHLARAGLFWNPGGAGPYLFADLREQVAQDIVQPDPGAVLWNLFLEPETADLATTAAGRHYGVAVPLLYLDRNGDGAMGPAEPIVAEAPAHTILFVAEPIPASDSPTGIALTPGYHLIHAPALCKPPEPGADECNVPLGAACTTDADCEAGSCLSTAPFPWPGGYCAMPDGPCHPRGSVQFVPLPSSHAPLWVKACTSDAECRASPYQCDLGAGACLPTLSIFFLPTDPASAHPTHICP
jgi:hypothetical protein